MSFDEKKPHMNSRRDKSFCREVTDARDNGDDASAHSRSEREIG